MLHERFTLTNLMLQRFDFNVTTAILNVTTVPFNVTTAYFDNNIYDAKR